MIGIVHSRPGETSLKSRMPAIPGLFPQEANGFQLQGPPGYERAASTGTFWDQVAAKQYELPKGQGLGAPIVHGQGLGAPIAHGMGLGGLGLSDEDLNTLAHSLVDPKGPGAVVIPEIHNAMKLLTKDERNTLGVMLIALGVPSTKVTTAKMFARTKDPEFKKRAMIWGVISTISMGASAYHGYKRNDSIGWALWWGLMGSIFPIITPVIGVAQGFGQPK